LSIPQLATLIQRAALFIGNNSGPMNMAGAMGTPTLIIEGPPRAKRVCRGQTRRTGGSTPKRPPAFRASASGAFLNLAPIATIRMAA
jgi:ADP-heptose:LPS heptosyltransferase